MIISEIAERKELIDVILSNNNKEADTAELNEDKIMENINDLGEL